MNTEYLGIQINKRRDKNLSEQSKSLLTEYYCRSGDKSPQEAYARACVAFSNGDIELAQRLYDAVSKNWFMFSSPILSNAIEAGEKVKRTPYFMFPIMG